MEPEYAQFVMFSAEWLIENTIRILAALAVLAGGWFLAGFLSHHVANLLPQTGRVDQTVTPLITQILRYGILVLTIVIALTQFGIETTSILAVLGAAGLAIALALQGTLSNIAAGVMLIWLRPFNAGEYIDGEGIAGTVVEIGLFGTRLRTYDGIYTFVPNSRLWDAKIINYSREPRRMVETRVGIAYDADLAAARAALLGVAADERVLPEPAPMAFVANLGASSVDLVMRTWVPSANWWQANVDFQERAKLALDAAGVEIPYGKLDVYVRGQAAAEPAPPLPDQA